MRFRHTLAITITAAAALALTACTGGTTGDPGSGADGKVTGKITFQTWSLKNDTFTPYFTQLISAFEKKYPGTSVNWIDQPADGYENKVLQQAESNNLPDVVNLPPEMASSLAQAGQLADLSKDDKAALSDYVPGGVAAYTYDGLNGTFGLPWYLGTELNYWNSDLLKKAGYSAPPTDIDGLFSLADKLAGTAKVPTLSSVPSPKGLVGWTDGRTKFMTDGKFTFNSPEVIKYVEQYAKLYKAGGVSAAAMQGGATANTNVNDFYTGKVAWTTATPNFPSNIKLNAPNVLPSVAATADFGQPPLFVQGIGVSGSSKNTATAIAFANFVTNNDNQIAFVKLAQGFYPGTKAANANPDSFLAQSDVALLNETMKLGAAEMSRATVASPPLYTDNMNTYSTQQIALAIQGQISAKQALDAAVKYCNENVSK